MPLDFARRPMDGIPEKVRNRCPLDKRTHQARRWCVGYMAAEADRPRDENACLDETNGYNAALADKAEAARRRATRPRTATHPASGRLARG